MNPSSSVLGEAALIICPLKKGVRICSLLQTVGGAVLTWEAGKPTGTA